MTGEEKLQLAVLNKPVLELTGQIKEVHDHLKVQQGRYLPSHIFYISIFYFTLINFI
jgi:hypothetical protein